MYHLFHYCTILVARPTSLVRHEVKISLATLAFVACFSQSVSAAFITFNGTPRLHVFANASASPFNSLDGDIEDIDSNSAPPFEIIASAYDYSSYWWGYTRVTASHGILPPAQTFPGWEDKLGGVWVYAAAEARGVASASASSLLGFRVMPELFEQNGQPITLSLMLAEGVWDFTPSAQAHHPPYVIGRVDVTSNYRVHPTYYLQGGHDASTFVLLRDIPIHIGDSVRIEILSAAGGHGSVNPTSYHDEVAAFLFAELLGPTNPVRYASQFTTGSSLSAFPTLPSAIPESSSFVLSAVGLLGFIYCLSARRRGAGAARA